MDREQTTVQIGLRVTEDLSSRIETKASEIGISKNALLLMLIDLGFKFYEGKVLIIPDKE